MEGIGYDGDGGFIEKWDLYLVIGTEGISTPKYGIWGAYLGTPYMVRRGVLFLKTASRPK